MQLTSEVDLGRSLYPDISLDHPGHGESEAVYHSKDRKLNWITGTSGRALPVAILSGIMALILR